jgi:3-oxoacyl-[acyl-carrier protein] reductase
MELEGKVALVTGASRNIGRAIARTLAEAGAAVVVNTRRSREDAESVVGEIRAAGGRAMAQLADVADEAAVTAMVDAAVTSFGRLDILVNNAANRPEGKLDEIDLAAWREVLATVLDGAFICVKAALPYLRASGAASIVNIGGMTGHTGATGRAHVIAAKAGLAGLTRALALDLAADGVTVNCVAPGLVDTVRSPGGEPRHYVGRTPPVGRRGFPEEIAGAVRWLCGPTARYTTGQVIHVNGGTYLGG